METRLAQPLAPMPDWAALTIAGCVLVFMDAMLFVILSPYRIVAGGAAANSRFSIGIGSPRSRFMGSQTASRGH